MEDAEVIEVNTEDAEVIEVNTAGYISGKFLKELASKIDDDARVLIAKGSFKNATFKIIGEISIENRRELIIYIR